METKTRPEAPKPARDERAAPARPRLRTNVRAGATAWTRGGITAEDDWESPVV